MRSRPSIRTAGLITAGTLLVCAQNVSVDWFAIGTGGGVSSAGNYTLTGTIGQPDTGRLHSHNFTIEGGFWSIVAAIQEPGAPLLSVRLTETNTVVVSWPITWPGFALRENLDLNTTNWTEVAVQPVVVVVSENRAEKQVVVAKPAGNRFYRLKGP